MSSPIYTGFSSPICIFSLPLEVIEQILVACAFSGSPESIAAFSQTCRIYSELVYGSADNHLWREIYLAAFDDPRLRLNVLKRPFTTSDASEVAFEWRNEYQCRIRAGKMLEASVMDVSTCSSGIPISHHAFPLATVSCIEPLYFIFNGYLITSTGTGSKLGLFRSRSR